MDGEKFIKLFCLIWVLTGRDSSAVNLTKNFDLDSLITDMLGNHGSGYPDNSQGNPGSQGKPSYQGPSNPLSTMNPGNNQGYPPNGYQHPQFQQPGFTGHPHNGQGGSPQYQRPANGMIGYGPGLNYQGRPSQTGYPQYGKPNGINNNVYPGYNPGYNRPGYYQIRPNQINNPQGNIWNNANENPGMNYPGGSQFFPGNSAQNPQYQRPGYSGNPANGLPFNHRRRPGVGNDWNSGNSNEKYYPDTQVQPGRNWNNPNGYPSTRYPNQISDPGNQFQTQGVDQQNPGLIQGQAIQYPSGDFQNYRPGLQNADLYNPPQSPNGLNNQLPNLQNTPNFDPTLNNYGQQNALHKNRPEQINKTEKVSLGRPTGITSQSSPLTSPSRMKQCVQDCPSSTDYSPRCGSDNVTYFNEEKVQCARKCGFDVKIVFDGNCPN